MANEEQTGKRFWDVAPGLIQRSWPILVVLALVVAAISIGITRSLFNAVNEAAEPGTTIKLYGLEFQKAKAIPVAPTPSAPDEVNDYRLPKDLFVPYKAATPILDGSLAIERDDSYSAAIVGSNIGVIRVGSRSPDGRPASIYKATTEGQSVSLDVPMYIELEYHGKVFGVTVLRGERAGALVSVERKPKATLGLTSVKALPLRPPPTGGD